MKKKRHHGKAADFQDLKRQYTVNKLMSALAESRSLILNLKNGLRRRTKGIMEH
jgi:hypothetical protein